MTPPQKPGRSAQDYVTPPHFIRAVKARLGIQRFSHDFAADATNTQAPTFFDKQRDAFTVARWDWVIRNGGGKWGWVNPPFAQIGPWARRCCETGDAGAHMAFLVPAAVGSNWYRDYVHGHASVLALNGRIPFMPERPTWGYPKDCILCLFGPEMMPDFNVWTWTAPQVAQVA